MMILSVVLIVLAVFGAPLFVIIAASAMLCSLMVNFRTPLVECVPRPPREEGRAAFRLAAMLMPTG